VRSLILFTLLLSLSTGLCSQTAFILPVKHKVQLTGNYGEIRPNHFHAGLDFKTDPKEHLPIYAIGDGYVSRIKVSAHGYGKVLYITHPNGCVSVYGHQYSFNETITGFVRAAQEKQQYFEIELFPRFGELKVKQGEIIGYTGNTGDSEGPHLHFEIRDERSEVPLNPLRFIAIADTVAPVITALALYEDDKGLPLILSLKKKKPDTVVVGTKLGIGVECYDLEQKPGNRNNVSSLTLFIDGTSYHCQQLDSISFDQARYVNAYADYETKKLKKGVFQKCFRGKNNELPVYKSGHDGFIYLDDTLYHTLTVKVADFGQKTSEVSFVVKRKPAGRLKPLPVPALNCLEVWKKIGKEYTIEMPAKSLYRDADMRDSFANDRLYFFAKDYAIPLHRSCTLGIRPPVALTRLGEKLCLTDASGAYFGGSFADGYVTATTKTFGVYRVEADTLPPKVNYIKPRRKKNKPPYKTGDLVAFKVTDELSGIGNFRLFVNDKFQLAEYEHKADMIFFTLTEEMPKGELLLRLEVSDKKNNAAVRSVTITYP
jgi:hypothetical protein